ncbi:MAG: phosphoribosyltransferase, partial [Mesorhizobium sp.]
YAAVFGLLSQHNETDIVFEVVPHPRMFQWNFMHHVFLEQCCVDIDGVLCLDPTADENDDGPAYEKFLTEARPL